MSDDILKERRKVLEQIFHQRDQKLLDQIRSTLELEKIREEQKKRFREVSGITDEGVFDLLMRLNVAPETFAALALIPLVRVAWADKKVQGPERDAVLQAAREEGFADDSDARRLLEAWLEDPPASNALTDAWKAYLTTLLGRVSAAERQTLKSTIMERVIRVADAAGGILGLGRRISDSEQAVIDELNTAFEP